MRPMADWHILPGGERVLRGLAELDAGKLTHDALLVLVAAPRLRALGIEVPSPLGTDQSAEDLLYNALVQIYGDDAHARFNSYRREIVSFAEAWTHV